MGDKKIIGIDLGRESLKCVVLSVAKDKARVEACRATRLAIPVDADDEAWRGAAIDALKTWREEKILTPECTIVVSVPSAHIVTRALKIPTETLGEQIAAEADRQLPFSLSEVDWDYAVVGEDGDQSQITLAAAKKEAISGVMSLLGEAGLAAAAIDSGALALGNLCLHAQGGSCSVPTAILSIGATASNLTVIHGERVWMRTLPVTGASIITSLCKNLSMSEEEARDVVFSKVNLAGQQDTESNADKNVRATITRLVMEVTRSLTFYRSQLGGEKPEKLFITGGYSAVHGLAGFLGGRLKIDVAPLQVFEGLEGGDTDNALWFGEALGCALAGAGLAPYALNLLPKDVQFQQILDRKKPWVIAAACLLAVLFLALFGAVLLKSGSVKDAAAAADEKLTDVSRYDREISKVQKQINKQLAEDENLRRVLCSRDLYTSALQEICKILPSNVWLSGVENITFGDIYEQERMETDEMKPGTIAIDEQSEIYVCPVRVLLRGGCYGNWTAEMPKLQEKFKKLPGIAGFTQRRMTKEKKYYTFEINVDLDGNGNGVADLTDIKSELAPKRRPGK